MDKSNQNKKNNKFTGVEIGLICAGAIIAACALAALLYYAYNKRFKRFTHEKGPKAFIIEPFIEFLSGRSCSTSSSSIASKSSGRLRRLNGKMVVWWRKCWKYWLKRSGLYATCRWIPIKSFIVSIFISIFISAIVLQMSGLTPDVLTLPTLNFFVNSSH